MYDFFFQHNFKLPICVLIQKGQEQAAAIQIKLISETSTKNSYLAFQYYYQQSRKIVLNKIYSYPDYTKIIISYNPV